MPTESSQPSHVQIVAPCTMQEGYTFIAQYGESTVPVTVPTGGVKQGQTFSVPFPSSGDLKRTEVTPFIQNNAAAVEREQLGKWKDSLWDCFRLGSCHPSLWNALCCPQILMAQVLTRLKMDWLGERAPHYEWKQTFPRIFIMVCLYYLLSTILSPPSPMWIYDENGELKRLPVKDVSSLQLFLYQSVSWAFGIYTLVILTKLRRAVRMRYEIPIRYTFLGPWEDCCLSFWCGCCSVAQLARQTCQYEEQEAACCSPKGLGSSSTHPVFMV